MPQPPRFPAAWLTAPVRDYLAALNATRNRGPRGVAAACVAFVLTWFAYVPLHELLHAWGCLLCGGDVTRLDIAPKYGGALLARIFPYVVSGSEYAGQLSGFDTHGNDATYLVTVLAPYLLTVVIGVPLLKRAARPGSSSWLLGVSLPLAYAPFISVAGDFYEAGSILVSRVAHGVSPGIAVQRWRSDDLFKLVGGLYHGGATAFDAMGVGASIAVGLVLAVLTYQGGVRVGLIVR